MIAQYGLSKVQEMIAEVEANGGELTDNIKQQIVCPFQDALLKIISLSFILMFFILIYMINKF
jgi:hypothetical protein